MAKRPLAVREVRATCGTVRFRTKLASQFFATELQPDHRVAAARGICKMTDEQDKSPGVTDSFLVRRLAKDAHITEVQARNSLRFWDTIGRRSCEKPLLPQNANRNRKPTFENSGTMTVKARSLTNQRRTEQMVGNKTSDTTSRVVKGQELEVRHLTETTDLSPNQARALLRKHGNDWAKIKDEAENYKAES